MTKAVFLDRDGVINRYPGDRRYVTSLKAFKFLKGSLQAIRGLSRAGFRIYVISNQAGVTKKLYTKKTLDDITRHMLDGVRKSGGKIKKVLYCLHTEDENCPCRKPKTGLLKEAVKGERIDLKNSYFIGDSLRDVKTGRNFGVKTVLVLSGREKMKNVPEWDVFPDFVAKTLASAAKNIILYRYDRA